MLQDPNIIWIGHHLGFRAFGLAAGPDRGRRPSGVRIIVRRFCKLPARTGDSNAPKLNSRTPHIPLRAAIEFERVVMASSRWKLDTDAYA